MNIYEQEKKKINGLVMSHLNTYIPFIICVGWTYSSIHSATHIDSDFNLHKVFVSQIPQPRISEESFNVKELKKNHDPL